MQAKIRSGERSGQVIDVEERMDEYWDDEECKFDMIKIYVEKNSKYGNVIWGDEQLLFI